MQTFPKIGKNALNCREKWWGMKRVGVAGEGQGGHDLKRKECKGTEVGEKGSCLFLINTWRN
jgi:hypothetical protein